MISFKINNTNDEKKKNPFEEEGEDVFDDDEMDFKEGEEAETEDLEELEEIESKLEKGEDVAILWQRFLFNRHCRRGSLTLATLDRAIAKTDQKTISQIL